MGSLRLLTLLWLTVLLSLCLLVMRQGVAFDSSLMALLPESEQQPEIQIADRQISAGFSNQLLLIFSGNQEKHVRQAVQYFGERLQALDVAEKVRWQLSEQDMLMMRQEWLPYRFSILSASMRMALQNDAYDLIQKKSLAQLFSPVSPVGVSLTEDPFFLFADLMTERSANRFISTDNSFLRMTNAGQPSYLLILTFKGDAFSLSLQSTLLGQLDELTSQWQTENREADITIRKSGLLLHAAAGAEQAQWEMSVIGLGSLLGIIALLLVVFRRSLILVAMMLPVTLAFMAAGAITLLVFGHIHLITLTFGAGLIGVSIDYSLHYLCERRTFKGSNPASGALRRVLPGLCLGLFSSVVAYGVLGFPPFPGLKQMAVFSVSGLISAWVSVVLIFPLLPDRLMQSGRGITGFMPLGSDNGRLISFCRRMKVGGGLAIVLFSGVAMIEARFQDDIRLLQTSPVELLQQEREVQTLLGGFSSSQYLLVRCQDIEQCLQTEEKVIPDLIRMQNKGILSGYQAISQQLPSYQRQTENLQWIEALYASELEGFFGKLNLPEEQARKALAALSAEQMLTLESWLKLDSSEALRPLLLEMEQGVVTLIRLQGAVSEDLADELIRLAEGTSQIQYVDRVDGISALLSRYRDKVISWLLIAYGIIFLVLIARYRMAVWSVILPPLLASMMAVSLVSLFSPGISLFHIMALILVLGIGLDMGIFLQETQGEESTWLAISLSCLTSLMAFGLLSLSQTPVLQHFGVIVLTGLIFSWLLAVLFSGFHKKGLLNDRTERVS